MKVMGLRLSGIRAKLIIALVSICIVPLIVLGIGSYSESKFILNNKLSVTSQQTLNEVDSGLTEYFEGFTKMVSITAKDPSVRNIDVDNNVEFIKEVIKNLKESDDDISNVYYGTESGKFMGYPEKQMEAGYDARQRSWYKAALEHKGQVVITPPYEDLACGDTVVGIVQAVEKDGQLIGVIGMDCTLATIAEKISQKKIGNSGYVFIAEQSGNILGHPQKELIKTNAASQLPIWDDIQEDDTGFVKYEFNGKKKFGAYDTNELTGWKMIATLDEGELNADTQSILNTMFIIMGVVALISIGMAVFISGGIANNMKRLKEAFSKASEGDLTSTLTVSTKDEFQDLAESFNLMMKNILTLIKSVKESSNTVLETSTSLAGMSEEITSSVSEVAKAIEGVSSGATEQVQNAQNGEEKMEELSKILDEISTNSNEMDKVSGETKELSSKGLYFINDLIEKANKTKESTTEVNVIVNDMNESTKEISAISETIAAITEQTNLLSLNASIESARAGEAGKGFAVVAEEIRKLAEQSKASTEEIKLIIANIQKKSDTAVNAIKTTEQVVNEQDAAVNETQKIFKEIIKSIEMIINKVDEVKSSVIDMNGKKQATIDKMENISYISEQTASASEEVTASAEEITATMDELSKHSMELQSLAGELENKVSRFKLS